MRISDDVIAAARRIDAISLELPSDGEYPVIVTSASKGEGGAYELRIRQSRAASCISGAHS